MSGDAGMILVVDRGCELFHQRRTLCLREIYTLEVIALLSALV